jgi:hypothetical protein
MKKYLTWTVPSFTSDNSISRAAHISQKFVLEEIYLVESKTWRKPGIHPEVLNLKNKCSTKIIYPKEYRGRHDIYSILCKFGVIAFSEKSLNKPVIKIEASFCTSFSYDLDDPDFKDFQTLDSEEEDFDFEKDDLEKYLNQITPISTAWPYWRELVQNMSTRMGFPALIVPSLRIVPEKLDLNEFID